MGSLGTMGTVCPRGRIKRVTVNVPLELHKELKFHSVANDTTMNEIFLAAVRAYLRTQNNGTSKL